MSPRWRILALMTAAQAGASVVQQALGSISPALVATFGLSKTQLGIVFTAMWIGSASCTALAGVLTDRWGERRMVVVSGVMMTAALLAATLIPVYWWLVVTIAVFGAGYAASTPAGGRAIMAWFDRDRGLAMGIRQTGVPVGGLIGALTLPAVAHAFGYRGAFVFAAVLVIVPTLVAYAGYREARDDRGPARTFAAVVRGMRALAGEPRLIGVTLTCMVLVSVQLVMNAFVALTAVGQVGTSAGVAALAFALAQGMAAVGRLWWGYASDRIFGNRLVPLAIICVLAAAACLWLCVARARGGAAAVPGRRADGLLGRGLERADGHRAGRDRRRRTRRQRHRPGADRDLRRLGAGPDGVRRAGRPHVAAPGLARWSRRLRWSAWCRCCACARAWAGGPGGALTESSNPGDLVPGPDPIRGPRAGRRVRTPSAGIVVGRSAPRWRNW